VEEGSAGSNLAPWLAGSSWAIRRFVHGYAAALLRALSLSLCWSCLFYIKPYLCIPVTLYLCRGTLLYLQPVTLCLFIYSSRKQHTNVRSVMQCVWLYLEHILVIFHASLWAFRRDGHTCSSVRLRGRCGLPVFS